MSGMLTDHLIEKGPQHPNLQLLNAQWAFDKELIPKALQNIGSLFPHFSRHDASHSLQILINIERLLGHANIKLLTATDTWMLLEAAFWHDVGMVVMSAHVEKDLASQEFTNFVYDIASQKGHDLQFFAEQFISLDPKTCFSAANSPQNAVNFYRQLLAEWYRKIHPERTEQIIGDPWEEAGISSPRSELVPRRLFRILGSICRMHGSPFDRVLTQLPFAEAGMADEDCHPRFIACMLRLGDLFDLDDNRFCPVMLGMAGVLPSTSQAHLEKHASLRHMRLDPESIELIAECTTYKGYEITDEWFSWIRNEIRDQMSNWKDIVPSRAYGLLPTLGKMEVNLAPPNEILNPGERPRFGVDPEKVLELLQGAGLYESQWQSVRELLQNAVDATLVRIWLTIEDIQESTKENFDCSSPNSKQIMDLFQKYPIQVKVSRDSSTPINGKVLWNLQIQDHGIGISKEDITFMVNVGGSAKNNNKNKIIRKMPTWLRPSGAFGIGLQSAFLITNEIRYSSKSILSTEALSIRMTSPMGPEKGMVYIRRLNMHPASEYGTILNLEMLVDAIPSRITLSGFGESRTKDILAQFDPICQTDVPYATSKLIEEIINFAEFSPIPIKLLFDRENIPCGFTEDEAILQNTFFDRDTGISLLNLKFQMNFATFSRVAFRGQILDKPHINWPFVSFIANLQAASAVDTLTINRNEVKEAAQDAVNENISKAILNYLKQCQLGDLALEEKVMASAYLVSCGEENTRTELKDLWKSLVLPSNPSISVLDLCKRDHFKISLVPPVGPWGQLPPPIEDAYTLSEDGHHTPILNLLYREWIGTQKRFIQVHHSSKQPNNVILNFDMNKIDPFSDDGLRFALFQACHSGLSITGRYRMPAWGRFTNLAAKTESLHWVRPISNYQSNEPQLILPFFLTTSSQRMVKTKQITTQSLDELCSWTYNHSVVPGQNINEIRCLFTEFIKWIDDTIMHGEAWWKESRK